MGVGRRFVRNKSRRRPKKSPLERRRREKLHVERLAELGVGAEVSRHMTPSEIRAELRQREKAAATQA